MNKHFLMIGFTGKKAYIKSALAMGAKISLLVSKKKYKAEYDQFFHQVFVVNNIYSWDEVKSYLDKSEKIDAVFTRHEDYVSLVGAINQDLDLKGLDYERARRFCNKYLMKKKWLKDSVPCADGICVDNLKKIDEFLLRHSFPMILKKTSAVHSNFVLKVKSKEDLLEKIDFLKNQVRGYVNSKPVTGFQKEKSRCQIILEEMLSGRELTVDTFVSNGRLIHTPICEYVMPRELNISDSYLPIRTIPINLDKDQESLIYKAVEKALFSLEANNCVCHTEVFFNESKNTCHLIESTPRSGGNRAEMVNISTGFDYSLAVFLAAAGLDIPAVPKIKSSLSVVEYFAESKGFLTELDLDFLNENDFVSDIKVRSHLGDQVNQARYGGKNIILFYVHGQNAKQSKARAIELFKKLRQKVKVSSL